MIRPTEPSETSALVALARGTGVFRPAELTALREVLDDYHEREHAHGHRGVTLLEGASTGEPDEAVGFAYFAPSAMSERAWYLWWIVVAASRQGHGAGTALLNHVEAEVQAAGARLLWIETSSRPDYGPTRAFYLARGYAVAAVVPDFYADGDDQVLFVRRFEPRSELAGS